LAPRGRTPVISHRFTWERMSVAAALVYEPDGRDTQLLFGMRLGAYDDDSLIELLAATHNLLNGRKVTSKGHLALEGPALPSL